jgi:hypothetical protein
MLVMNTLCRLFAVDVMAHQQKTLPAFKTLEGVITHLHLYQSFTQTLP